MEYVFTYLESKLAVSYQKRIHKMLLISHLKIYVILSSARVFLIQRYFQDVTETQTIFHAKSYTLTTIWSKNDKPMPVLASGSVLRSCHLSFSMTVWTVLRMSKSLRWNFTR